MSPTPIFVAGLVLFGIGAVLFNGLPFFYGGWSPFRQFAAMRALIRGEHGHTSQALFLASFAFLVIGVALFFLGSIGAS